MSLLFVLFANSRLYGAGNGWQWFSVKFVRMEKRAFPLGASRGY